MSVFLSGTLLCQMPHYLHTVKYTAACNHFQTSVFYMCCVCMFSEMGTSVQVSDDLPGFYQELVTGMPSRYQGTHRVVH